MYCKRCNNVLSGRQESYCSLRCSKLHLKSLWRKRNKEKVLAYNRKYRALGVRPLKAKQRWEIVRKRGTKCVRCGGSLDLNVHHFKPLRCGGTNNMFNVQVLCFSCHMDLEKRMKGFWDYV